jgi:hypothetical protein
LDVIVRYSVREIHLFIDENKLKKIEICKQKYSHKKDKMSSILLKNIAQEIERSVSEFADRISAKYSIPKEDILELWSENGNASTGSTTASTPTPKRAIRKKGSAIPRTAQTKQKEPSQVLYCPYRYMRKPRVGQVCGAKARVGGTHCSKHKAHENKEVVTKRLLPKPRQNIEQNIDQKEPEYRMRLNAKLDKFWHPETRLVFKNKGDITVIGYVNDNDELENLTEDHIRLVKEWRFKLEEKKEDNPEEEKKPIKKRIIKKRISIRDKEENAEKESEEDPNLDSDGSSTTIDELGTTEQDIERLLHEIIEPEQPEQLKSENLKLFDENEYTDDEIEEES